MEHVKISIQEQKRKFLRHSEVLSKQTADKFNAMRCSGMPEVRLGLSNRQIFRRDPVGNENSPEIFALFLTDATRLWKQAVQALRICENLKPEVAATHVGRTSFLGLYRVIHSFKGTASLLQDRVTWAKDLHSVEDELSRGLDRGDFGAIDLASVAKVLEQIGEQLVALREEFHSDRKAA